MSTTPTDSPRHHRSDRGHQSDGNSQPGLAAANLGGRRLDVPMRLTGESKCNWTAATVLDHCQENGFEWFWSGTETLVTVDKDGRQIVYTTNALAREYLSPAEERGREATRQNQDMIDNALNDYKD